MKYLLIVLGVVLFVAVVLTTINSKRIARQNENAMENIRLDQKFGR